MVVTVAFVLPFVVVATMLVRAMMPLWTGETVMLDVVGRDPRDLMRGDYVQLAYTMSALGSDTITFDGVDPSALRYGDDLYVVLRDSGATWRAARVTAERPSEGRFLHGRVAYSHTRGRGSRQETAPYVTVGLTYGIEEYYTDPETAQAIERRILSLGRDTIGGTLRAELRVDADGDARIVAIH